MRLAAVDRHLEGGDALVPGHRLHAGGLAHDHRVRPRPVLDQRLDQSGRPQTADLLVIAEGELHRPGQRSGGELGRRGQRQGQEALHVRRAATIEATVAPGQDEGIGGPGLAVHRHHIGVARQQDPSVGLRADPADQVGLGAVWIVHPVQAGAAGPQLVFRVADQLQIGAARGRVEGDQPFEDAQGAFGELLDLDHDRRLTVGGTAWGIPSRRRRNRAAARRSPGRGGWVGSRSGFRT